MNLRAEHGAIVLAVILASACGDDTKDPANDAGGANNTGGTQGTSGTNNNGADGGATAGNNNGNANDGNGNAANTNGGGSTGSSTSGNNGGTTGNTGTSGTSTGGTPCDASKAPTVGTLGLEVVNSTFSRLVDAAQPPGSTDWYLVQQTGQIIVLSGGEKKSAAFLDVSSDVTGLGNASSGDERGLLGLTFAPDYATSGKFYVAITLTASNTDVVREYTRSSADPYVADAASKKDVVVLPSSATNHNGGVVRFGPDGMLYIGTGDGGGSCSDNKGDAPQDVGELFGKILRVDPSKTFPDNGADGNPFAANGDARVYHYGLRNPFRFNFDRGTGDLYIGDVGQNHLEEVSFAASGSSGINFGWPVYEGNTLTSATCKTGTAFMPQGANPTAPIFDVNRRTGSPMRSPLYGDWVSVIGGVVYRGSALPSLTGVYLFGDYTGQRMAALCKSGAATSPVTPVNKGCDANAPTEACLAPKGGGAALSQLMAIVEGNDGEMYIVGNRTTLFKIVPN
jgi:glucose/arabinose dehydrogenase